MSDSAQARPVPEPDSSSSAYWDAAKRGELVVQRCAACDQYQFPPDVACVHCQSTELPPTLVSGDATLYSFTVVERPFHAGFASCLPYVVGLVELAEQPGLRMLTNIVDAPPESLTIGMALRVTFEDVGDMTLPQFRPAMDP